MTTQLKPYNSYLREPMISVSKNSVYISTRTMAEKNICPGMCLEFHLDENNKAIGIKVVTCEGAKYAIKVDRRGYCRMSISKIIPVGRYTYKYQDKNLIIFKKNAD